MLPPRLVAATGWLLVGIATVLLAVLLIDLSVAWNAPRCGADITATCYPWGAEGPAADAGWHYTSRKNYLISSVFEATVLAVSLSLAVWLRSGGRIAAIVVALFLTATSNITLPWVLAAL